MHITIIFGWACHAGHERTRLCGPCRAVARGNPEGARKRAAGAVCRWFIDAAASDARRAATTDPDQQNRSKGGTARQISAPKRTSRPAENLSAPSISGPSDSSSYLKARTALTVYQAQERQIAIQKKKGVLVDRARAETLVFRLARQERDAWVTWPARVAAIMAVELSAEMEKTTGESVSIGTGVLQRVLETHARA